LTEPAVSTDEDEDEPNLEEDFGEIPIVLHDFETSSFEANCDILQIDAKRGKKAFTAYVNLSRKESATATAANGLMNCSGDLV
jgi:hypothetical protein